MAIYIAMGVPAKFLLAASIISGSRGFSDFKIVYPETEESKTKNKVSVNIEKPINLIDAIAHGASDGMRYH